MKKEKETAGDSGKNYTYIIRCGDGSLYTGWTNRLAERVAAHQSGRGAKYTRGRGPVELVYWEVFSTREAALSREAAIKKLSRKDKLALIRDWKPTEA